jgi:hypothetical protein
MLMRFHKTPKKWNGAGTFGFLATLKGRMNNLKTGAQGAARIELAHRL